MSRKTATRPLARCHLRRCSGHGPMCGRSARAAEASPPGIGCPAQARRIHPAGVGETGVEQQEFTPSRPLRAAASPHGQHDPGRSRLPSAEPAHPDDLRLCRPRDRLMHRKGGRLKEFDDAIAVETHRDRHIRSAAHRPRPPRTSRLLGSSVALLGVAASVLVTAPDAAARVTGLHASPGSAGADPAVRHQLHLHTDRDRRRRRPGVVLRLRPLDSLLTEQLHPAGRRCGDRAVDPDEPRLAPDRRLPNLRGRSRNQSRGRHRHQHRLRLPRLAVASRRGPSSDRTKVTRSEQRPLTPRIDALRRGIARSCRRLILPMGDHSPENLQWPL